MFIIASVCFNVHVNGCPPRPACGPWEPGNQRENRLALYGRVHGMGTPESSGTGRKQAVETMVLQAPGNAFSAKFPIGRAEKDNFRRRENSNHRLNDNPAKPWYTKRAVREQRKRRSRREGERSFKGKAQYKKLSECLMATDHLV